jgi:hypothetical protein
LPKRPSQNARENTSEDSNWDDRKSVVVSERLETAIYRNGRGGLIIRQRSPGGDCWIVISNTSVNDFIGKLVELAASNAKQAEKKKLGLSLHGQTGRRCAP